MKKLLALALLTALFAIPAQAQFQDNMMGLYFDPEGMIHCIEAGTVPPFSTMNLYLILHGSTYPTLYGFEAGMTIEGDVLILGVNYPVDALNVGTATNQIVGFGAPLDAQEVTILCTFSMLYSSATQEPVCFRLHGSEPSSIDPMYPTLLVADGQLVMAGVDPGPYADCTAEIGYCVSSIDAHSFDSLKALYR